jgi:hypothetical protein
MPDGPTPVDLLTLHAEIKNALDSFTGLNSKFYERETRRIDCPAIYFELDSIQPEDPSETPTEQTAVSLIFSAYLVESYRTQNARLLVRRRAAELAAFIQSSDFCNALSNVHPPSFDDAQPDEVAFSPGQSENPYEVFRVDFSMIAILGESVFDDSGTLPNQVFAGYEPRTGPDHLEDYTEIEKPPDL